MRHNVDLDIVQHDLRDNLRSDSCVSVCVMRACSKQNMERQQHRQATVVAHYRTIM